MNPQSLAPHTGKLIEAVSRLECIKPFVLVGGTALSIQLKTRQSEDLDFMRYLLHPEEWCRHSQTDSNGFGAFRTQTEDKGPDGDADKWRIVP